MSGKKTSGVEAFVRRLNQACDDLPNLIPPHGEGRQIVLAKKMGMSQEGIRKWFAGEAMPRRAAMAQLARLLEVEEPWLALGITPELSREEKKLNARSTDAAVLFTMGMIIFAGGAIAEPSEKDPRRGYVDFYAILGGTQLAVHVSLARKTSPSVFEIVIPREYREVKVISVIPLGNNRFDYILIDSFESPQYFQRKAGGYTLSFTKLPDGKYGKGEKVWNRIKNFGEIV